MRRGEKRIAMRIVYQAAQIVEKNTASPFLSVLEKSVMNVKPSLETKSRKFGVESAKENKESKPMFEKLAEEIKNAYNKTGGAFKKKETIHKEAMGNMEFAPASFNR
ncbi:5539_t:CDS:2 [Funneliformis geosporum]|uniref:5539_t:CDS:1 n=1 Tax=Funneliformis geosporum TaxID=1117311 RepID=A0A9W4WHD7_9GLOM|nr:5539_t:CDS:2 [Funneliformis geosporum]